MARLGARFVSQRRRLRIALLVLVASMPLLAGGWLWLRSSPFVSVQHVQITGVHGTQAPAVDAALTAASHRMSTLDVSAGALEAAVAPLRVVRSLRAIPSFPHGLRIEVTEQLPVASLTAGGQHTAVAGDGVVLGPSLLSSSLPSVSGEVVPAAGRRVSGASLQAELTVLGAAPTLLLKHVERVFTGTQGITAAMRNGLLVYFGDDTRPHAKWLSLARVLADPSSAGAYYVDVRLPSHPAAGFPAGVTPPDQSSTPGTSSTEPAGGSESAVSSLAAGLSGGGATTSTGSPTGASTEPASAATEPATTAPSSAANAAASESTEVAAGEAGAAGEGEAQAAVSPGG